MDPYIVCCLLKKCGFDDISKTVFERLKANLKIPTKIKFDGTETQISYEELICGLPDNVFKLFKLFSSFIELCRFHRGGTISEDNLLFNKNMFFNITNSLKNEVQIRSDLIDSVKYARSRSTYLNLRSFRLGTNDQLVFSDMKQIPFLNNLCGKFIRSNYTYAHQHFDDSEFGLMGDPASIYVIKSDKTGTVLITGGDDGMIRLWNPLTGNLLTSIKKHIGDIIDIDINSCNALLASCCGKGQLIITLLSGNDWIPIAIIENTDRTTYVKFAYSKHGTRPNKDDVFHESEMLISASDSAIISIYKVSDIFIHGASHHLNLMNRNGFPASLFKGFASLFYQYEDQIKSQNSDTEMPLFYKAPPIYKIDIFPLVPKAFDICLSPFHHGFLSEESIKSNVFFSVGAALHSSSSSEEMQIKISGNNVPIKFFTIQKHIDRKGYSLVFMIPLEHSQDEIRIKLIDMPQNHGDHPDVSFANNSHDLVTASDDGIVILWTFSHESVYNQIYLNTYISDRIGSGSYFKKKSLSAKKGTAEKSSIESISITDDDSDYMGTGSMDESTSSRINPLRTSMLMRNNSLNQDNNKYNRADGSQNVVQFIDSVQWSCNDSIILIAQSVVYKGILKRNRDPALVNCIECCVSYFSKSNGKRFLDIILPNTHSRIACLVPHPNSPGIVLSLTYDGTIFVISNSKSSQSNTKLNKGSNVLFEHKNTQNPYLNGIWFKDGLGFVVSQKYGSFEIYNMCNMGDLNQQVLSQSYRFNFPEQFFLSDFSEILLDGTLGWIDANIRRPIYMMPRPVIVDKNRVMYPEDVQPPIPMESSVGVRKSSPAEEDILENRLPFMPKYISSKDSHKTVFSPPWMYLEGSKRRYAHRKNLIEQDRHLLNNAYMDSNGPNGTQPRNMPTNEETARVSSQNNNSSDYEDIQSYSSDSSNDEDFDINCASSVNSNRRLRAVSRSSPSASDNESSSSFEDSSLDENEYDSDLTSEDSLYNEIRCSLNNARPRRESSRGILLNDTNFDIEGSQKEIEFRYYALSNLNTIWAPDCEEVKNSVTCKLCNKSTTTIIGYKYLVKSDIEFNSQNTRPVLHGVNGSIDLGPLIGPFDYRYSTRKPDRNNKFLLEKNSIGEEGFYIHSRCLITIPFLQWELIDDQIYTNLFDVIKRTFKPSGETPPLPKKGISTFFDSKLVKFPKRIGVCSYCNEYGASILCQGNKCNRQFHYYCSSLIYHSFPELMDSSFISPRESDIYWCDIMQFYLFYCPKCINLKQSNVPYCPRREKMIDNSGSNHCNRSWLLTDEIFAGYAPQINDYLYFFPGAYNYSGIDDMFFKNIILEATTDNKKSSRRSNRKLEFIKCKLINISYAFPKDTEEMIKAILTFSTETNSGKRIHWQLRCTPNDGPDFLVLEDDVEKGLHNLDHRFRIGQENYIFIDGQWHEIILKDIKPDVIWESIEISWKQEENDNSLHVSPWEIHESIQDVNSSPKNLDTYDDLIKIFSWITSQDEQNNALSIIEFFKYPIPFYSKRNLSKDEYSNQEWVMHYWKEIPLPFSFNLIIYRVRNNYYRRMESLVFDIFLVRSNCEHFNMNNNNLVQGIRSVEYELLRLIFSKRLPRYITEINPDTSLHESEPEEQISATNSSTIESEDEIINRLGRRTRRRI